MVIADWYEENAQPERAEFIRVQIAIEGMNPFDSRYPNLMARQIELHQKHQKEWSKKFNARWEAKHFAIWHWEPYKVFSSGYRRGFIGSLLVPQVNDFLGCVEKILEEIPLQFVGIELREKSHYLKLIESPVFTRLRGLRITPPIRSDGWKAICDCKNTSMIRYLACHLDGVLLSEVIEGLTESFQGLRELQFVGNLPSNYLKRVLDRNIFPQLRMLTLLNQRLNDSTINRLILLLQERPQTTIRLLENGFEVDIDPKRIVACRNRMESALEGRVIWL